MKYFVSVLFGLALSLVGFQALGDAALAQESGEYNHEFSKDGKTLIKVDPNATSLNVPKGVGQISPGAFLNCSSLESIDVEKGNSTFFAKEGVLFNKPERTLVFYPPAKSDENYAVPNGTVKVLRSAFAGSSLKAVKFPATLEILEWPPQVEAFYVAKGNKKFSASNGVLFDQSGKTLLRYPRLKKDESYTIPKKVVTIAEDSFMGTPALKSVNFEEGVVTIETWAFNNCSALESVKLPNSLKNIESGAFCDCNSLKSLRLPDGVSKINSWFVGRDSSLSSIEVSEKNKSFKSVDGVLFSKDGSILFCYPMGKDGTSYKVPKGVEKLGGYAFYRCVKLEEVELPEGVKELDYAAFSECFNLRDVKMPSTIENLGRNCFEGCRSLESINLSKTLKSFGEGAFNGCSSLPERLRALDDLKNPAYKSPILGENITVVGVDLDGNDVPADDYKGKVVLIDCWTTWCGPCLAEIPHIKEMYEKYHGRGFEVISYNCDDDLDKLEKFVKSNPLPWKVVSQQLAYNKTLQSVLDDESGEVKQYVDLMRAYHTDWGFPQMFLVGRDGKIIDSNARGKRLVELLEKEFSSK